MTTAEDGESWDGLSEIGLHSDLRGIEENTVVVTLGASKTRAKALELAPQAHRLAAQVIARVEHELGDLLPPVACKAGCCFCCYHQVLISPPEAVLIGDFLEKHFSERQRQALAAKAQKNLELIAGKDLEAIVQIRPQLKCAFLQDNLCTIYAVRPMGCRAWSSKRAEQCEIGLAHGDPLAGIGGYIHRQKIAVDIHHGLLQGTKALGLESGYMDLAGGVNLLLQNNLANLIQRWLNGEEVFSPVMDYRV
ncbi:MAG: YkgJ family cysteine cluster protein [Desulfobacca sp.]|nr:YkgJ family cysteine cluster protein [Desulfobacca sp.]